MKTRLLVLVVILMTATTFAQTSGFVEFKSKFDKDGNYTPTLDASLNFPVNQKFGISLWVLQTKGWNEAYVGPSYSPASWVSMSISVGMEDAQKPWRTAQSLWLGGKKVSSFTALEEGGSGFWYTHNTSYEVAPRLALGIFSEKYVGTGPYFQVEVCKRFKIWGTPIAYGQEGPKTFIVAKFLF